MSFWKLFSPFVQKICRPNLIDNLTAFNGKLRCLVDDYLQATQFPNRYLPLLSSMMVTTIIMTASLNFSLAQICMLPSLLMGPAPLLTHPLLAHPLLAHPPLTSHPLLATHPPLTSHLLLAPKDRFTSGVPSLP